MKFSLFWIAFFTLWITSAQANEDSAYERKIYNIYLKHYKNPVSHSDWNNKIRSLPKSYQLKFKDNLWDLSGSFFKNYLYWSKLWVANPKVENPHLIYQGNFIKFDPKNLLAVNTSKYSVDIQAQFPGLVVSEPPFSSKTLTESEIPSSLPSIPIIQPISEEIDISQLQPVEINKRTLVPFYLSDSAPSSVGEIISKEGYGKTIGVKGEQIIVKIDRSVTIGSILTIFENKGQPGGFFNFLSGQSAEEIAIKGQIKVLSYIRNTDSLYSAVIINSLQPIFTGDQLLRQADTSFYNFSQTGPIGQANGVIFGSPEENQIMLSLGSIVYLDKGSSNGLQTGDIVYARGKVEKNKVFNRPYKYESPLIGKIKVIHTSGDMATGIIVSSRSQIYVGDSFSSQSDKVEDLSESLTHEPFEDKENQQKGEQELLMNYEEVSGDEPGAGSLGDSQDTETEEAGEDFEEFDSDREDFEEISGDDDSEEDFDSDEEYEDDDETASSELDELEKAEAGDADNMDEMDYDSDEL